MDHEAIDPQTSPSSSDVHKPGPSPIVDNLCEVVPPFQFSQSHLVELASGVDALYLSGRASLPASLIEALESAHAEANSLRVAVPFQLGELSGQMAPHAFGRYRYCLDHPYGRIGFTLSNQFPAIRVQPRTEFLQGAGPRPAVAWFRSVLESVCGPVSLSVNRLDLFGDFQNWNLSGDSRHEFVCRAQSRHTYEDNGILNGFIFGTRKSDTVLARIYDKTIESSKSGSAYWKMIWGDTFDAAKPVIRVEFELGRTGLREYGVTSVDDVLDAAGSLWASLTREWLTHRLVSADQTRSRWAVSPAWESVSRASLAEEDWGIRRTYLHKRRGGVENLMPGLVGYLASFGAFAEAMTLEEMLPHLNAFITQHARNTGITLPERVAAKRRKLNLP